MNIILKKAFPYGNINSLPLLSEFKYFETYFTDDNLRAYFQKYPNILDFVQQCYDPKDDFSEVCIQTLYVILRKRLTNKAELTTMHSCIPLFFSYLLLVISNDYKIDTKNCMTILGLANSVGIKEYAELVHNNKKDKNIEMPVTDIEGVVAMLSAVIIKMNNCDDFREAIVGTMSKNFDSIQKSNYSIINHYVETNSNFDKLNKQIYDILNELSNDQIDSYMDCTLFKSTNMFIIIILLNAIKTKSIIIIDYFSEAILDKFYTNINFYFCNDYYTLTKNFNKVSIENALVAQDKFNVLRNAIAVCLQTCENALRNNLPSKQLLNVINIISSISFLKVNLDDQISNVVHGLVKNIIDSLHEIPNKSNFVMQLDSLVTKLSTAKIIISERILEFTDILLSTNSNFGIIGRILKLLNYSLIVNSLQTNNEMQNSILLNHKRKQFAQNCSNNINHATKNLIAILDIKSNSVKLKDILTSEKKKDKIDARICLAQIINLCDLSNYLHVTNQQLKFTLKDITKKQESVYINSCYYIVEVLQDCFGTLNLTDLHKIILPTIKEIESEYLKLDETKINLIEFANSVLYHLYSSIKIYFTRIFQPSLTYDIINDLCNKSISLSYSPIVSNSFITFFVTNKHFLSQTDYNKCLNVWQIIFNWCETVYLKATHVNNEEQVLKCKDLLTCICSILPDNDIPLILSKFILAHSKFNNIAYINLAAIVLDRPEVSHDVAKTIYSLLAPVLNKIMSAIELAMDYHIIRAWLNFLNNVLKLIPYSNSFKWDDLTNLMHALQVTQKMTHPQLWKTRLITHQHMINLISYLYEKGELTLDKIGQKTFVVKINFIFHNILFEACWKTSSISSVTRRRARRVLLKLIKFVDRFYDNTTILKSEFLKVLYAGLSCTESFFIQRGFVNAIELLLNTPNKILTIEEQQQLSELLSLAKPIVYNIDNKSANNSSINTTTTKRSYKSIKQSYIN